MTGKIGGFPPPVKEMPLSIPRMERRNPLRARIRGKMTVQRRGHGMRGVSAAAPMR